MYSEKGKIFKEINNDISMSLQYTLTLHYNKHIHVNKSDYYKKELKPIKYVQSSARLLLLHHLLFTKNKNICKINITS